MKYAITYIKVKKLKTGGLEFEGPIIGPVVPTADEAHQRTKTIVSGSKIAIISKIYEIDNDYTLDTIMEKCMDYFERKKRTISESTEITNKPIRRSK